MSDKELKKWWLSLSEPELDSFIKSWFKELDSNLKVDDSPYGGDVVLMNFLASDIKRAFDLAYDAEHLTTLAAGPVEHLLGFHGEKWIDTIEKEAARDKHFAWMMLGVWQHKMSDSIWERVKKIQDNVKQNAT